MHKSTCSRAVRRILRCNRVDFNLGATLNTARSPRPRGRLRHILTWPRRPEDGDREH